MSEGKKERGTAPVVIGEKYHKAMNDYYATHKIKKRHQVEFSLDDFFKKNAPEIFKSLADKKIRWNNF